ncbi:P1 family peptidase [Hoeflea sp. YIM 152468]|uniref:DmpA family aminopeptidase n=1 Tax=Hoeflea sp. YIM 152468 TaxID=3031759 RepID=UPI0023D9F7E5|nr:P1 family peptidase [Hoeflea sp. YIM 152468]MDF1609566.1 P1 family peptidase [Hoeflea sp. YIM 152468]
MIPAWKNTPSGKLRAKGLGLRFEGASGPFNAITDVAGVSVGYSTIITGEGPLVTGKGPVRTGVTAIVPRPFGQIEQPLFAGFFSLNGNGELSGSHYIEETGKMALPVTITNTHSCGIARDATIRWAVEYLAERYHDDFALPVAAETYDGFLNDINGFHVEARHVIEAIEAARGGAIEEGSVGGGTGMKCFGFKAGSGTSSRRLDYDGEAFTIGVFVQANFGTRRHLTVLGRTIGADPELPAMVTKTGDTDLSSIIVVIATDAPFLPHQLKRLARRASFGIGRTGGMATHGSGDLFLAFSTAASDLGGGAMRTVRFVPDEDIDGFFEAVVQATEEAILNAMIANEAMTGRDGNFVPALPHEAVKAALGLRD